jgi:hypothetical protein
MILLKRIVSVIILNSILVGCSSLSQQNLELPQTDLAIEHSGKSWWYARFQIFWPEDEEPQWHIDALLAHQVIRPVLLQHRDQIDLWRFHRRAGRKGGHLFSFIFYADPNLAATIYHELSVNETLSELMDEGEVEKYITEDWSKVTRPNIEDTSDKHWNEIIQKSWPYYIMGVSEMWLEMITLSVNLNVDENRSSIDTFKHIHDDLTELWKNDGSHAFLHHLNALFAYKPITITETKQRLMRY